MRGDNRLTEADYQMLERSWISRALADDAGVRRVSSVEGTETICCNRPGNYAGLLFPYIWPGETHPREHRLRRDHPEMEVRSDGTFREKQKYLCAPGGRNHLYTPCDIAPETLQDVDLPVIIVEGEKKTLALRRLADWNCESLRFLPVGLGGVWNWRGTIGKEPGPTGETHNVKGAIPDFSRVVWQKRIVYVLFDSDKRVNPSVQAAEHALAKELKARGAVVKLVDLPDLPNYEKTGADDFLAHPDGGPERMLELIDTAKPAEPGSTHEILDRAGIPGLTSESGIDEVEAALRRLRREMDGVDTLRETVVRSEATKHLSTIGIQSPAQMVGAALARTDNRQDVPKLVFSELEPWPHPVNGTLLLNEITEILTRFIVLPQDEIRTIALWVVHTYAVEATSICPILIIKSAEKRCGKTLLLELLFNLVFRPLPTSNITVSSLFRVIEKYKPTLLLDECETFLHGNDEMRGIFNSGYRRSSAYVIRTVGDDFEPVVFNTFGPKAVAQINKPSETLLDRGIVIEMRRKRLEEKPERLRPERLTEDFQRIRQKAARWVRDNLERLRTREPQIPGGLNDRAQDSWLPLLSIAEVAGEGWAAIGRTSAAKLSKEKNEVSHRTLLLDDIRLLFEQSGEDRMASNDICAKLADMEEHPWPEWKDGQPITVRQLARMLEPLGIRPRQFRTSSAILRGYELEDFSDAFSRYLPDIHSGER